MAKQPKWAEEVKDWHEKMEAGAFFKLQPGDNAIRILPGVNAEGEVDEDNVSPLFRQSSHSKIGKDERFAVCGKNRIGEGECWLCDELIPKLAQSDSHASRAQAAAMRPMQQVAMQVAYIKDGKWHGPAVWILTVGKAGGKSMSRQLLGILKQTEYEHTSIKRGRNINIERTGVGLKDTRYGAIMVDQGPSKVPSEIVKQMRPLSELCRSYDGKYQQESFYGHPIDAAHTVAVPVQPPAKPAESDDAYTSDEFKSKKKDKKKKKGKGKVVEFDKKAKKSKKVKADDGKKAKKDKKSKKAKKADDADDIPY